MISLLSYFIFFFKQKTAYESRISDWSSDVCSSDLPLQQAVRQGITTEATHIAPPRQQFRELRAELWPEGRLRTLGRSEIEVARHLRTIRPGPHDRKPPRANSLVIKTTRREKTGGGGSAYASSMRSRRPVRPATGDGACQEGPRGHPDPVTREEAPWIRYAIPSNGAWMRSARPARR